MTTTWTMNIPGWRPAPLNKLMGHWGKSHKMKSTDRMVIDNTATAYGIPNATGKRRVDLLIIYPKGMRSTDPDSHWKSLLDALTCCGVLRDDTKNYVELGSVEYAKGEVLRTIITVTDVA